MMSNDFVLDPPRLDAVKHLCCRHNARDVTSSTHVYRGFGTDSATFTVGPQCSSTRGDIRR